MSQHADEGATHTGTARQGFSLLLSVLLPLWRKRNSGGVKSQLLWSCNAALPHTCLLTFPLHALNIGIFRILFPPLCCPLSENMVCRSLSLGCPDHQLLLFSPSREVTILPCRCSEIWGQIVPLGSQALPGNSKKNLTGPFNSLQESNSSAYF